jgi:hypothetical protein
LLFSTDDKSIDTLSAARDRGRSSPTDSKVNSIGKSGELTCE